MSWKAKLYQTTEEDDPVLAEWKKKLAATSKAPPAAQQDGGQPRCVSDRWLLGSGAVTTSPARTDSPISSWS